MTLLTLKIGAQNQGTVLVRNGVVIEHVEGNRPQDVYERASELRASSTGCYFMERSFALGGFGMDTSFERETLPRWVSQGKLAGANFGPGRFEDLGTPERFHALAAKTLIEVYGHPFVL